MSTEEAAPKKQKIEVGDIVTCVDITRSFMPGITKDTLLTVIESNVIESTQQQTVKVSNIGNVGWYAKRFQHAETKHWKKGDRVVCIDAAKLIHISEGEVMVIESIGQEGKYFNFKNDPVRRVYKTENFKLIAPLEEKQMIKKPMFKVGDLVTSHNPNGFLEKETTETTFKIGDIVTLKQGKFLWGIYEGLRYMVKEVTVNSFGGETITIGVNDEYKVYDACNFNLTHMEEEQDTKTEDVSVKSPTPEKETEMNFLKKAAHVVIAAPFNYIVGRQIKTLIKPAEKVTRWGLFALIVAAIGFSVARPEMLMEMVQSYMPTIDIQWKK